MNEVSLDETGRLQYGGGGNAGHDIQPDRPEAVIAATLRRLWEEHGSRRFAAGYYWDPKARRGCAVANLACEAGLPLTGMTGRQGSGLALQRRVARHYGVPLLRIRFLDAAFENRYDTARRLDTEEQALEAAVAAACHEVLTP